MRADRFEGRSRCDEPERVARPARARGRPGAHAACHYPAGEGGRISENGLAEALAEYVAVINRGRLVAQGTPRDVTSRIALRRVRFRAAAIPDLEPVAHSALEKGVVTLYTPNADLLVRRLFETQVEFSELEVLPAGLEEAFVRLTRDDPAC